MNALSHAFTAAAGRCNVGGNAKVTRGCGVTTVARGALMPRAVNGRRASEGRRGAVPMHRARQWKQLGPQGTQQLHGASRGAASARLGPRSVVTCGLPIPIIGGLFTAPVLAIMYVFVAIRLWLGYEKTNFTAQNKAMMVALWPVLAVASASFRENLKKATL
mmetsp:Transcript_17556/g.28070  ORF Transcript_17556/g.28070 Transcript_17556/m.28070 type:complete len:162 (-) Transcript_17556:143-628(-)|eukprot:CAMPEP_0198679978 /NCGR_PEP_ID=MMETSP1468-20131203/3784_1 /TAXON_ID=1461545 /ORGANISM="Mantoniella sp, Strain CCMP1436" /LENGTH=161 /DNA_ID=CAMNT_0044419451 /DNA_START=76 /DNA_END=561 /DNA_ORIENTATION=-